VVADAPGGEDQRKPTVGRLERLGVLDGDESRASVGVGNRPSV
jgi:hypothetical protein